MTTMDSLPYQMLGPEIIETNELLFWPDNPRLKISDFEEVKYSEQELLDSRNQNKIYEMLLGHEYGIPRLVESMSQEGFNPEKALIVMEVGGKQNYLVLEGNRRLTAIRTVLAKGPGVIGQRNYDSLLRIPCWLFVHCSNTIPLSAAISRLVSKQHIVGQQPHTGIQTAHMLYNAYMGFLLEDHNQHNFSIERDTIERTTAFFDMREKYIEEELAIVRLYKQLRATGHDIPHNFKERLSWVYEYRQLFTAYFGYEETSLLMDDAGLNKYYELFVMEGCAVHNPDLFKKFLNVMRNGSSRDIEIIRNDPEELLQIEQMIKDKKRDQRFRHSLEKIEKMLSGLIISEYRQSKNEDRLIGSIADLVGSKLIKLPSIAKRPHVLEIIEKDEPEVSETKRKHGLPTTVAGACNLKYDYLSDHIMIIIDNCDGKGVPKKDIPSRLLGRWDILPQGDSMPIFFELVNSILNRMEDEGRIEIWNVMSTLTTGQGSMIVKRS